MSSTTSRALVNPSTSRKTLTKILIGALLIGCCATPASRLHGSKSVNIDAKLEAARIVLARKWMVLRNARDTRHEQPARERWEKGEAEFRLSVSALNRRIDAWNLKTPAIAFHRNRIDVEREIDHLKI